MLPALTWRSKNSLNILCQIEARKKLHVMRTLWNVWDMNKIDFIEKLVFLFHKESSFSTLIMIVQGVFGNIDVNMMIELFMYIQFWRAWGALSNHLKYISDMIYSLNCAGCIMVCDTLRLWHYKIYDTLRCCARFFNDVIGNVWSECTHGCSLVRASIWYKILGEIICL